MIKFLMESFQEYQYIFGYQSINWFSMQIQRRHLEIPWYFQVFQEGYTIPWLGGDGVSISMISRLVDTIGTQILLIFNKKKAIHLTKT